MIMIYTKETTFDNKKFIYFICSAILFYIIFGVCTIVWQRSTLEYNNVTGFLNTYLYGSLIGNVMIKILCPVIAVISVLPIYVAVTSLKQLWKKIVTLSSISSIAFIIGQILLLLICYVIDSSNSVGIKGEIGVFSGIEPDYLLYILIYYIYSIVFVSLYSILGYAIFLQKNNEFHAAFFPLLLTQLSLYIPQFFSNNSGIVFRILPMAYDNGTIGFSLVDYLFNFLVIVVIVIILMSIYIQELKKRKMLK